LIQTIPLSSTDQEDMLIWRGSAKGQFSVKSAYFIQKEMEDLKLAGRSSHKGVSLIWKALWKMQIPNAKKVWFWRARHNALPTRANLHCRKVIEDSSCPYCGRKAETMFHILWKCPYVQDV
jgi:hypothetical protein